MPPAMASGSHQVSSAAALMRTAAAVSKRSAAPIQANDSTSCPRGVAASTGSVPAADGPHPLPRAATGRDLAETPVPGIYPDRRESPVARRHRVTSVARPPMALIDTSVHLFVPAVPSM